MNPNAIFSPCRIYRYTLWRGWDLPRCLPYGRYSEKGFEPLPLHTASDYVQFIGLNPSTADEVQDDPTVRRCIGYAKAWGFGAMCMTNLFAYRATDPAEMLAIHDPVGMDNDRWLNSIAADSGLVVCAWGNHGEHIGRAATVLKLLESHRNKLRCLKMTKTGQPQHPLYLPKALKPKALSEEGPSSDGYLGANDMPPINP